MVLISVTIDGLLVGKWIAEWQGGGEGGVGGGVELPAVHFIPRVTYVIPHGVYTCCQVDPGELQGRYLYLLVYSI